MNPAVPALQFVGYQINSVVVASDHDERIIELVFGPKSPHLYYGSLIDAFQLLGDLQDSVRAGKRCDYASPSLDWHCNQSVIDPAEDHADKFFQAQLGRQLPAKNGRNGGKDRALSSLKRIEQRSYELFEGHDR